MALYLHNKSLPKRFAGEELDTRGSSWVRGPTEIGGAGGIAAVPIGRPADSNSFKTIRGDR